MNKQMAVAVLAVVLGGMGLAVAADKAPEPMPHGGKPGLEHKPMDHEMMHRMEMMNMCGGMTGGRMGGGPMRGAMMPQLPPGNEKLQLQMQAEMMQKMGEIMAKYADRIKEPK